MLVLDVIAGGRTIPVLWRTADKNTLKDNQTKIEMDLLKDFRTIVPSGMEVVILADSLIKPPKSLSRLEELAVLLAGITGNPRPKIMERRWL